MKKYIIIVGVNSAGKSTLYEALDELKEILKDCDLAAFYDNTERLLDYHTICLNRKNII